MKTGNTPLFGLLATALLAGCSLVGEPREEPSERYSPVDRPRYGFLDRPEPLPELDQEIDGRAQVVDGDTLAVDGMTVHLAGIDAPETEQLCRREDGLPYRCGEAYAERLRQRIQRDRVQCEVAPVGEPDDDAETTEFLGICHHFGVDLGAWMVQRGYAVARNKHSPYLDTELKAAAESKGLWQGTFERPEDWRRRNR